MLLEWINIAGPDSSVDPAAATGINPVALNVYVPDFSNLCTVAALTTVSKDSDAFSRRKFLAARASCRILAWIPLKGASTPMNYHY